MAFADELYVPFIRRCFQLLQVHLPPDARDIKSELLTELRTYLISEDAQSAVNAAREEAKRETGRFIELELVYILSLSNEETGPKDADTVKESLKKWLTLPEWLDGPLDVLDELLKIAAGRD